MTAGVRGVVRPRPLVVTVLLDEATQARFDAERAALFPAGRTVVGAHVTLFHAVPGQRSDRVHADVRAVARRDPFLVTVDGLVSLGRGVAYRLESPSLRQVHETLRASWQEWLTPQDRQPFRPHITVQNKVDAATARATLARLSASFRPVTALARGLAVWRYDGGPWTPLAAAPFDPEA